MSKTVLDGLRFVLQNMRLQPGDMAKVQADIVAQAIIELEMLETKLEQLEFHSGVTVTLVEYKVARHRCLG